MYDDIPVAHLPADFAESQLPKNFYMPIGDTVYLSNVYVLNNAAILKVSQVSDLLATLGYCFRVDCEKDQSLVNTLQFAAEVLEQVISAQDF